MEKDIVPELLGLVEKEFDKKILNSNKIKNAIKLLRDKQATYKEANEFAIEIGEILAETLGENITAKILPNGKMHFNIADRILGLTMKKNHELISSYAADVQTELNNKAGLKIKGQKADINKDRIDGIINRISNENSYEDIKWILDEPVVNFSQSIIDSTIHKNAEFHSKIGLQPKIIRKSTGKCCDWCQEVAGVYDYPNVPKDIYRRHRFCRCVVDYYPGEGKKQNVHTKEWMDPEKHDKIEARKKIGLGSALSGEKEAQTPKLIQKIDAADIDKTIKKLENEIRDLSNENAIIALPDGSFYKAVGNSSSVTFGGLELKGAIVTHNHPVDEFGVSDSFGEDDFNFLKSKSELSRLRAVNTRYDYELKVLKPLDISYNEAYINGLDMATPEDEIQHCIMKWLHKEGYIEYTRNVSNSKR